MAGSGAQPSPLQPPTLRVGLNVLFAWLEP